MGRPWYRRVARHISQRIPRKDNVAARAAKQGSSAGEIANSKRVFQTAEQLGFTLQSLNLGAAKRQANIGAGYARDSKTKVRLAELQRSTITLRPHKSWTGDYTDWLADPFGDRNWRFQFQTLRWINPYLWDALGGNEDSKAEWKRIVRSWADHNTPPERAPDKYAWMDMTDGNRAIQISIGAPLINADDHWYIDLLVQHREWLMDESNIVEGNHGLHQNIGLFVLSSVLSDEVGANRAIDRLGEQVLEVFDEEGLNLEGSIAYHEMNLNWWLQARRRVGLEGYALSDEATKRLDKAGQIMGTLLLPDGTKPQIGDGGRGAGRKGLHPFIDEVLDRSVQTSGLSTYHHYKNGFTVFRSGWGEFRDLKDESHTVIRHGKELSRHSHYDRGSIHLYNAGQRWISDGGFHSYQPNNLDRQYTLSRQAHSLVDLPNQNHDRTRPVPVEQSQRDPTVHTIQLIDENFEAAVWRRRVIYLPQINVWVVWDRIKSEMEDEIRQQWLTDVGIEANVIRKDLLALTVNEKKLHMQWLGSKPGFDIMVGDPASSTKRGLIGVGWRKMRPATSIHAMFKAQDVDSIVVISDPNEIELSVELARREPMSWFELCLTEPDRTFKLTADAQRTVFDHETQ